MTNLKSKRIPSLNKPEADRFWSKVKRDDNQRGCWLWTGSVNSKGYGRFFVSGKHIGAHRMFWILADRGLQANLHICHTCDNKRCVNPDHLIMADAATNNRAAMLNRNLLGKHAKAKKPYPGFPLFPPCDATMVEENPGQASLLRIDHRRPRRRCRA